MAAAANQLGSRRRPRAIVPAIGVAASTWRRSASSPSPARSNRNRLIDRLPFREARAEQQPLTAINVEMRLQIQAEVDAEHQERAGIRLHVPQPLPDRAPAIEALSRLQTQRLQLAR